MTTSRRPGAASRRTVSAQMTPEQRDRLRGLLDDPDTWVLRSAWDAYVLEGEPVGVIDPAVLTRDHLVASLAWLEQQRHPLHRVLVGGRHAPEGWLESRPLYQRLQELLAS